MPDERLLTAAALYEPCQWGADIGTDHGLLPCHLLQTGVCRQMILADVSPKALKHAEANAAQQGLTDRVILRCADGLDAIDRPCGCISVTGMGGETLSGILLKGQKKLRDAVLVLSAHTEIPMLRRTIGRIGYHIAREELCYAAGRYYIVLRAEPGTRPMSDLELRLGSVILQGTSPLLPGYLESRIRYFSAKVTGAAGEEKATLESDIALMKTRLEELRHGTEGI